MKKTLTTLAALCLFTSGAAAQEIQPTEILVAYYEGKTEAATATAPLGRRTLPTAAPRKAAAFTQPNPTLAGQVASCWQSPEKNHLPSVTLALAFDDAGQPVPNSIHLADAERGSEADVLTAFTQARAAILRCGGEQGYTMARAAGAEIELIFAMSGVLQ